jgi:hypothetical protein
MKLCPAGTPGPGGITVVGHLPLADIRALALAVRHKLVVEQVRRAVGMKLCPLDTPGVNLLYLLYSMTGADKYSSVLNGRCGQILDRLERFAPGCAGQVGETDASFAGTAVANLLYSLGGTAKYWDG